MASNNQWKSLWKEFRTSKGKICFGILAWVIILIVFHLLARTGVLFSLEQPITWSVDSIGKLGQSVVLLILAPLIHIDSVAHLSFNLLGLIIMLIPFMAHYGIRKSSFYLFLIGITTRILGLIIHQISVWMISLYNESPSLPKSLTVFKITIGVSGMILAMVGFFFVLMICRPSEFKALYFKADKTFWEKFYTIYIGLSLIVLVLVILIDTNNYLAIYGEWLQFFALEEIVIDFDFTMGNQYYGHLMGFILGCLLGYYERVKRGRIFHAVKSFDT